MNIGGVNTRKAKQSGKPRQPKRQKRADRITSGMHTKNEIMCDYALAPLDRLAADMDRKWGIDVLPELVSPEMAAKYGSAMAKLNAAIDAADPQEASARSAVCQRGLLAMDAEATSMGRQRASEDVWEVELEGKVIGIMKEGRSWQTIKENRPDLQLVSLREVAVALEYYANSVVGHMTEETKKHFPAAEVVGMSGSKQYDDEIPF